MIKNKVELIYLPALKITQEAGGTAVMANVAELGLLWNILKLPHDIMEEMIKETFKKKPTVIEPNINVFRAGASYIIKDWKEFGFSLHRSSAEGIILPAPNNQHIHTYFDLTPTGTPSLDRLVGSVRGRGPGQRYLHLRLWGHQFQPAHPALLPGSSPWPVHARTTNLAHGGISTRSHRRLVVDSVALDRSHHLESSPGDEWPAVICHRWYHPFVMAN